MHLILLILSVIILYVFIVFLLNKGSVCTGKCIISECDCPLKDKNDIQQDKRP